MEQRMLRVDGVGKNFGHVEALRDVSFEVAAGEIVGLVGDNGAGKSTIVKILSGTIQPDSGSIEVDGELRRLRSVRDARGLGIETVFQDLALTPDLDAVANLFLGRELRAKGISGACGALDHKTMRQVAPEHLAQLSVQLPALHVPVRELSGGQRQLIAIGRAMAWASRLLLLDEPTAALGVQQTEEVLRLVRQLADRGTSALIVSHNLPELLSVVDRVLVLRLGRVVANAPRSVLTPQDLIAAMTGLDHARSPT